MYIIVLLPIIYILGGMLLIFFPPRNINSIYGYRTTKSMKSNEVWVYAQKVAGLTNLIVNIPLFICAFIVYNFVNVNNETTISIIILVVELIISTTLVFVIPDKMIDKYFDKDGKKK